MTISLTPVGWVRSLRTEATDDNWGEVESAVELAPDLPAEAFAGLEAFSHVEILFFFDRVPEDSVERGARHPRGNVEWPRIGIFAQRGRNRPNRLGVSIAELLRVENRQLVLRGLDAIDGTPVLDIKPVMQEFLPRQPVRQPTWSQELMRHYWK